VSADERRVYPRFPSRLRCWLSGHARLVHVGLRDLSRGGLGLKAPTTFSAGELAEVIVEDPARRLNLRARCEVVWSHPDKDNPDHTGTGVRFVEILEGPHLLPSADASEPRR
jgi:hypothetical protein